MILVHHDESERPSIYTAANRNNFLAIVTQIPHNYRESLHSYKFHDSLAFLFRSFSTIQLHWYTVEKEAFDFMLVVDRLHYFIAIPEAYKLFTDHRKLIFILDPLAIVSDLEKAAITKVLIRAVRLSAYNCVCIYHW